MKYQARIVLASLAMVVIVGIIAGAGFGSRNIKDFMVAFGVVGFFGGLLELVIGLFLLLMKDKRPAQGMLMAGGILLLAGFVTCTSQL